MIIKRARFHIFSSIWFNLTKLQNWYPDKEDAATYSPTLSIHSSSDGIQYSLEQVLSNKVHEHSRNTRQRLF